MKFKKCQDCKNLQYNIPQTNIEKDIETGGKNKCEFRKDCDGINYYAVP